MKKQFFTGGNGVLTSQVGHEAGRYENFAVAIYLLLMMDALASDCKALARYRGWDV